MLLYGEQIDKAAWRALVSGSATGTWFQTPEAYAFLQTQGSVLQVFAVALQREGDAGLAGVCVGYVTRERSRLKQYFMRRAIIIGGACLADDCRDEEVELLMGEGLQQALPSERLLQPIYIETRNFNDYSRWREAFARAGFAYEPHLNIRVDCRDKEQMWSRLSDTRKKQIRRAERNGVQVRPAANEQEVRAWYRILRKMYRERVKLPLWPESVFVDAYLSGAAQYTMVCYGEQVIGGLMSVRDEKCVYEWYECGLDSGYEQHYPSVMATFAGMDQANKLDLQRCDFMGAGVPGVPYGVRDFKERFGGETVEHGRFLNVREPKLFAFGKVCIRLLQTKIAHFPKKKV